MTTRRRFMQTVALAGAGVFLAPAGALAGPTVTITRSDFIDRKFPLRDPDPAPEPTDPNVRTIERYRIANGRWSSAYEQETGILAYRSDKPPLPQPFWEPWEWSRLREHEIFRVREPDGAFETDEMAICIATGPARKLPDGVWSVEVAPLTAINYFWLGETETETGIRTYTVCWPDGGIRT